MGIAENSGAEAIGKLQRVSLREVWKHEALDFTSWLQQNIDVLNDAVGLSLSAAERERAAGDFSVDLVAEDEGGNPVVIENQLEKSNHDHLGKLLTYLVALGAKTAIWIVSEPRSEHVSTISWLNESSSGSFYILKVEAIRIGDSPPAPLLTLVVGPTEESREVGWVKKEWAERETVRYQFWSELLERSRQKTSLHTTISPGKGGWIGKGAGRSGLGFNYVIREHDANAELYIDRGKDRGEENRTILRALEENRTDIEERFGGPLTWESVDERRACRVVAPPTSGGYRDEDKWPVIHEELIASMISLESALSPHISQLRV